MSNDTNQNQVQRYSKCRNVQRTIKLSQIDVDKDKYCHRENEKADLDKLAESLAQEGQQTPMVVIAVGDRFLLIAGHRRYYAHKKGIEDNLPGCTDDMDVSVTEMVKGKGQSDEDFEQDVIVRSVSDNTNRLALDEFEKLKIAKDFDERGIQAKRTMIALDVKESQYRRFLLIVKTPWLYNAVLKGQITATNAAKLVEATTADGDEKESKKRMETFQNGFEEWASDAKKQLAKENERRLNKQKAPKEGKDAYLKQYADPQAIREWDRCLKAGTSFGRVREFRYGIDTDVEKLTLEIPSLKLRSDALNEEKLCAVIGGFEEGIDSLYELLAAVRRRQPITKDEVQALKTKLREGRQGQDADDFNDVEPPQTTDVAAAIKEQRSVGNQQLDAKKRSSKKGG